MNMYNNLSKGIGSFLFQILLIISCTGIFVSNVIAQEESNATIGCSDVEVLVLDTVFLDSLSFQVLSIPYEADTVYHIDNKSTAECTWRDFKHEFHINNWKFSADNDDGSLDSTELPLALSIEGAKNSPRNNYRRYIARLKRVAPISGYLAFDWESYGGSYPQIDAFYFTVNDSCVQLSKSTMTSGRFISWYIEKGDTISLEQTSNGTSNHITTRISSFEFYPKVYQSIERQWISVLSGDTTTCVQKIKIVRPGLKEINVPPNFDDYDAPKLNCEDKLSDVKASFPYIVGLFDTLFLSPQNSSGYSAEYHDELINACGGNKTILRRWQISDQCSGASIEKSQIIKIRDNGPIQMKCPKDQAFYITKCNVSVFIRKPRAWTVCNEDIDVKISWAYGEGSRVYNGVTPGKYEITFIAKDNCGLEKVCSMWLNLIYKDEEDVQCKSNLSFILPPEGVLRIYAKDLVEYKTACAAKSFMIEGQPYLDLDCSDIGKRTYWIEYFDPENPNDTDSCAVEIELKSPEISVICPDDITVTCSADAGNLDVFGKIQISGVSDKLEIEELVIESVDQCNTGTIQRIWTVKSDCEILHTCSQTITLTLPDQPVVIDWPDDYQAYDCTALQSFPPQSLPEPFGFPRLMTTNTCDMIEFQFVDSPIVGTDHCFSFRREWKGTSSCDPYVLFTHTQEFFVSDTTAPKISIPSNQIVFTTEDNCIETEIILAAASAFDCGSEIEISNNSQYAYTNGADASGIYPIGITSVSFTAEDACGNKTTHYVQIEVKPQEDSPINCFGELKVTLSENSEGNFERLLRAAELVAKDETNCQPQPYIYSFSKSEIDTTRILTCDDLGLKGFEVFRKSHSGDWGQCNAWVMIEDPDELCQSQSEYASISGQIYTEGGKKVKYVQVGMNEDDPIVTDDNGYYQIGPIPTDQWYEIVPQKEINIRNGINTLDMVKLNRHLLGTVPITSPYALIACDLNNSNSISVGDLYLMNGLILGTITKLEKAWKFVPSDYTFIDPTDPFKESFPQSYNIKLDEDKSKLDFIAIKSGDPNLTADPQKLNDLKSDNPVLEMTIPNKTVESNIDFNVEWRPNFSKLIDGLQFTLEFDPTLLELVSIQESFGLEENLVFNTTKIESGILGVVFLNYFGLTDIPPLSISFKPSKNTSLNNALKLGKGLYVPEVYIDGEPHLLELNFSETIEGHTFSIAPNPSRGNVTIEIHANKTIEGHLSIMDINGRIIARNLMSLSKGSNIYTLEKTDFENAGIYLIHLHTEGSSSMQKVVIME